MSLGIKSAIPGQFLTSAEYARNDNQRGVLNEHSHVYSLRGGHFDVCDATSVVITAVGLVSS